MPEGGSSAALEGLVLEGVEWLPSGAESGLLRVRGLWTDLRRREEELPALGLRRGAEARRFDSLPDARFGRDPAVWRGTYLVPAALMDPAPDELWLSWESGAHAALPDPARGLEPPATEAPTAPPERGGEVIDRAVLAERRARRAEAAERAQAQRAAEALKAVEVLELRSAELERRLEALQSGAPPAEESVADAPAAPAAAPAVDEATAVAGVEAAAPGEATTVRGVEAAAPGEVTTAPGEATTIPGEATTAPGEDTTAPGEATTAPAGEPPTSPAITRTERAAPELPAAPERPAIPAAPSTEALTAAVATVKRLRHELGEQRQRLRRSELLRAADAVALASLHEEEGRARRLQQELSAALAAAEQHAADAAAAREQAAEQVSQAAQRSAADAAAVRQRAAQELAAARAALTETRDELDAAGRDLTAERTAHAQTRTRLTARERELAAIGAELGEVRAQLATVRQDATERAAELERRLEEIEGALAEERRAHGITATDRETARAGLANAESALSAESVARAALDDELDRDRAERAALARALTAAEAELTAARTTQSDLLLSREESRAELASARAELDSVRERTASAEASVREELESVRRRAASAEASTADELESVRRRAASAEASTADELKLLRARAASAEASAGGLRTALEDARSELAAARARIAELEGEVEASRGALDDAGREAGGLLARIAELERAADDDLERRARDQADAAAAVAKPTPAEQRDVAASLDAAATALRARPAPPAEPAAAEPAPAPARPRVVTEAKHPPRADIVGSSKRAYPWLRGALVKLAHDDPRAATRLVLGLVPAQRALVEPPLEYDLTIRGSGTYAISVAHDGAAARSIGGPRPRAEAAFHVAADIVTITELLAGVDKRMGRWLGPVRVRGRRGGAEALRAKLARADLDLAAAARAGADLDPDLVFRAFAYAIHPSWTKGHSFTVAQEIDGARPIRWHVLVRDGAPVAVERRPPADPPEAVVAMSRKAFSHLLRGEPAPSGERPAIRGDRTAVALLKTWTDRAQGRSG